MRPRGGWVQAANGRALYDTLARLWPDVATRPRLIGPDAGGFSADYIAQVGGKGPATPAPAQAVVPAVSKAHPPHEPLCAVSPP